MPSKQKGGAATRSLRGLIGGNRKNKDKSGGDNGSIVSSASDQSKSLQGSSNSISIFDDASASSSSAVLPARTISMLAESSSTNDGGGQENNNSNNGRGRGGNIIQRLRERSRSRSRAKQANGSGMSSSSSTNSTREMLVAVTSCRSDGYYNQKAPGSTFKLPRKAPTNLKLFHELAVGVKDAYAAVGATPRNPNNINVNNNNNGDDEQQQQRSAAAATPDETTLQARMILWDFIGNLDFLLALVDEVSVDTATRGALKDDATFKGVRDVIKKGNRVLEDMLVRRERKYTLFFRLVQETDSDQIGRMRSWNAKVEKAVSAVTGGQTRESYASSSSAEDNNSDTASSSSTTTSSISSRAGVFSRGRQLLPTAGRVRARRATPTPRLRQFHKGGGGGDGEAASDGFSTTVSNNDSVSSQQDHLPNDLTASYIRNNASQLKQLQPLEPKDELVDVIRGLRVEKQKNRESTADDELAALKPSWRPKAEIPSTVPKLPTEYVHRHRLMKQVVSCLLDENEIPTPGEGEPELNTAITCVTSRHGDKAGNGKSTLAVAVIQTVEVRERFADGIAWLKLGRGPLGERDIRRLYEELYRQLIVKEADVENTISEDPSHSGFHESMRSEMSEAQVDRMVDRADSARRFQGGDLEGIKEDLARMIVRRNILICLDDVWKVEDVKWFIFETPTYSVPARDSPYKILLTTRIPSLLGNGTVQEIFVRILSEHEAVKLLLSTAGRRPYGGRNSAVFNQSKMIVKGCGNSPLGILLVGSMLRHNSRNWNLNTPVWTGVYNQCSLNLEEAAQMRSFKNAFLRIVDMSFFTIENPHLRVALRRCFLLFAMAFRQNDWMLSGRGIPQSVVLKFFETVVNAGPMGDEKIQAEAILETLEQLKLIQRARHSVTPMVARTETERHSESSTHRDDNNSDRSDSDWDEFEDIPKKKPQQFYTMHDSLKAVAEKMSERSMPCFTPTRGQYTFYAEKIDEELGKLSKNTDLLATPIKFLAQQLKAENQQGNGMLSASKIHLLVVASLARGDNEKALSKASITDAMRASQVSVQQLAGGRKFEEYTTAFLPEHLILAQAHSCAAELLVDSDFVCRRVFALGIMEATGRQVADVLDLRNNVGKGTKKLGESSSDLSHVGKGNVKESDLANLDIEVTVCDASRIIIDEVYKVTNSMGSSDSLGMATCLATVGESLLKCRQPKDAMLRLEEAVSIYRGLLGPYHVYVAHALHSVAKALTKLGETRVALLKFAEAARIYETCNATLHYDSISNAQSLASLLVDIGDIRKAEAMFEEVIAMKQTVYGETSVPVAKTINNYAILLAKHGRMTDALRHYDIARSTYLKAPPSLIADPEFDIKCKYDVTLITLNIASIHSKKGDLDKALECYEEGVAGLGDYEDEMSKIREMNGSQENPSAKGSSHKHLVAALGRIGSIKMKRGDHDGALEAYLMLVDEVDDDSPLTSHIEKAKAHIKCGTIFRKKGSDHHSTAVSHLKEALRMYKAMYDPGHKDTAAIATTLKQWLAEDKANGS